MIIEPPDFMFNKKTGEIVMLEDIPNDTGAKITLYRPVRVIYKDTEKDPVSVHNFVEFMEDLESQGFVYIK